MTTATVRCTQPGCGGTIQDGYRDTCGLDAPAASSGAPGSSGSPGSPVPYRDPASAVLKLIDRADAAAGYLATLAGFSPAQRIVALTLAVAGDATIPREVTESAETRLSLVRAMIDAGDCDAAATVLAELAAGDPSDWRVAWYNGWRDLAARGPGGAQIAQGAFSAVLDELPGELAPKLALAFAAEQARRAELVDMASAIRPRTLT